MKKQNKKGFTLVELVIVIAVIAILAAVLIPTYATVQGNARKSSALQKCRTALTLVTTNNTQLASGDMAFDLTNAAGVYFTDEMKEDGTPNYIFQYVNGTFENIAISALPATALILDASATIDADSSETANNVIYRFQDSTYSSIS